MVAAVAGLFLSRAPRRDRPRRRCRSSGRWTRAGKFSAGASRARGPSQENRRRPRPARKSARITGEGEALHGCSRYCCVSAAAAQLRHARMRVPACLGTLRSSARTGSGSVPRDVVHPLDGLGRQADGLARGRMLPRLARELVDAAGKLARLRRRGQQRTDDREAQTGPSQARGRLLGSHRVALRRLLGGHDEGGRIRRPVAGAPLPAGLGSWGPSYERHTRRRS